MTDNASQKQYSGVTCRGSYALGTACGMCKRCRDQIERQEAARRFDAACNTPSLSLRKIKDLEEENARLKSENADLKGSVIAFCAPWAVKYARDFGFPEGHLHPTHYDILEKAGARMVDFTRAVLPGMEAAQ